MKTEIEISNERILELEDQVKKLTSNTVLAVSLPSCMTCKHYEKFAGQIKGSCKKIHYSAPQCDAEGNRISIWNDGSGEMVRVPDNYGCVLHEGNDR